MAAISLIIPNYNKRDHLDECLASAVTQGGVDQIILVDDGSTDGSAEWLRGFAKTDDRIQLLLLPENHGQGYAANRGLELANGKYVCFLDSDDLLLRGCLERRYALAEAHPSHDMWVFPMQAFRDPRQLGEVWRPPRRGHLKRFLAHRLPWQNMQPLWRREFLVQIGGYDESFPRFTDVELFTKAIMRGASVRCFPELEPDCLWRVTPGRHSFGARALAHRHVAGAIHYYRTFYGRARSGAERRWLGGTLLMALSWVIAAGRDGRIAAPDVELLAHQLVDACAIPWQRLQLRTYLAMNRRLPRHVKGLRWAFARMLLT